MTARARTTDPDTSHEAAESVTNMTLTRQRILSLLFKDGPMCDADLVESWAQHYGRSTASESGIRTRRAELVRAGLVRDSGRRRPLPSGRRSVIWARS